MGQQFPRIQASVGMRENRMEDFSSTPETVQTGPDNNEGHASRHYSGTPSVTSSSVKDNTPSATRQQHHNQQPPFRES